MTSILVSITDLSVEVLVLDAVYLLQQVAQAVHEQLLFQRLQHVRAVRVLLHHRDGRVGLPYFYKNKTYYTSY